MELLQHPHLRRLADALPDEAPPLEESLAAGRRASAVAALLRPGTGTDDAGEQSLELLLIRRTEREGDTWSGHVALPGGRADLTDRDIVHTAMRETLEEVGIDLAANPHAHLLGALTALAPRIRQAPALTVHPFVWSLARDVAVIEAPDEVAAHHWVPLAQLEDPARATTHRVQVPELGTIELPGVFVGEDGTDLLWGMTLQIVRDLLGYIATP